VAVKIILKKNVRGNEQMVLDELDLLQRLKHPHIVKFVDWFESRVRIWAWHIGSASPPSRIKC
jgi:serine/threonine protein kinase